jgi:hypothetical protein
VRAGTLVVDIAANVARLQTDMASAKGIVAGAMNDITRSVNVAKTALGALGVSLGAGALAAMALSVTKATAALDDMAEVTGAAVEELSKLQVVAKIGGHDFGLVEDSLVKLTKGLKGTEEETKNARQALVFLGIQAKTAAGALRDPGEMMREVALKLATFEDGAGKTALALDLFGKSGAKLLPFLKDMAEEGTVNARVTAEQAAEAEKFEKAMGRLSVVMDDARRQAIMPWTSTAKDMVEQLSEGLKIFGGWTSALYNVGFAIDPLKSIAGNMKAIREELEFIERMKSAPPRLAAGVGIGDEGQLRKRLQFLQFMERQGALANSGPGDYDARDLMVRGPKPKADYRSLGDSKPGKTAADLLNELAGVSKDFYKDLELLHAELRGGRVSLEHYQGAVGKLIEKQAFAKELERQHKDEIKKLTEASREAFEASREAFEAEQRRGVQMIEFTSAAKAELDQLEFENSLIYLNSVEREKAIALRRIENDLKKASKGLSEEEAATLRIEADAAKQRTIALLDTKEAREQARDASKAASEEWLRAQGSMWQSIDRTAHDTFVSIFDSGKSAFDRLKDTLKNGLFDLLYQMTVRPFIVNIAAAVSGGSVAQSAFGASGGLFSGGGGGGGFGGIGNIASSANSLFGGGGGLFGANGAIGSSIANIGGGTMLAGGAAGTALAGEAAALGIAQIGGSGAGALGAIGTAMPYVGAALAVASMLGMFGGDGGGPKPSQLLLRYADYNAEGSKFDIGDANLPGGPSMAAIEALEKELNDPDKYDPEILAGIVGPNHVFETNGRWIDGEPGESQEQMMQRLLQIVAPAANTGPTRSALRSSLLSAQNPAGYWKGQVGELGAGLGTSASTIEEWRAEFLKALDEPIGQSTIEKWQALGAAIEQATNAAGVAASAISTSAFSTLVDYRRAVRLAGGIPKFASGGYHGGGMALVGEMGPELMNLPAGRIYSNSESRRMMDMSGVEGRLSKLENGIAAVALHTSRIATRMDEFRGKGMPVRGVDPSTPLEVSVAS